MQLDDILGLAAIGAAIINLYYSYYERIENFFWNWPAYGLIALSLFFAKAYATALMLIIQALVSTHGFFVWTRGRPMSWRKRVLCLVYDKDHGQQHQTATIQIATMTLQDHLFALAIILLSFLPAYYLLQNSDDISPFIDASSFALFSVATVLLNFKKIEGWIYYIIADGYACVLSYETANGYNIAALVLFMVLDAVIFKRWLWMMNQKHL